ncbi:MAG: hypothetical protein F6J96_08420 [Symploca sp. SIO1C2]|nr:hypothetical protein [Symploca sp. SIO1C2]
MSESSNTNKVNISSGSVGGINMGGGMMENVTSSQTNNEIKDNKNLAEAAKEIQALLTQLEQTNPNSTESDKEKIAQKAVQEIKKDHSLKERVVAALQAGGVETFKQMLDHSLVHILVETFKGAANPN